MNNRNSKTFIVAFLLIVIHSTSLFSASNETKYLQIITDPPGTVTSDNENWGSGIVGSDNIIFWPDSTITWDYNVGDCQETSGNTISALAAAFEKWDDVTTSSLNFEQGDSIAPPSVSDDGNNIVLFESDDDTIPQTNAEEINILKRRNYDN